MQSKLEIFLVYSHLKASQEHPEKGKKRPGKSIHPHSPCLPGATVTVQMLLFNDDVHLIQTNHALRAETAGD